MQVVPKKTMQVDAKSGLHIEGPIYISPYGWSLVGINIKRYMSFSHLHLLADFSLDDYCNKLQENVCLSILFAKKNVNQNVRWSCPLPPPFGLCGSIGYLSLLSPTEMNLLSCVTALLWCDWARISMPHRSRSWKRSSTRKMPHLQQKKPHLQQKKGLFQGVHDWVWSLNTMWFRVPTRLYYYHLRWVH